MPFPKHFQPLLEISSDEVGTPDYVWLVYAVCAVEAGSCGWQGWIIDGAFRRSVTHHPTGTGDELLSAPYDQKCPVCGRTLFRTSVEARFDLSADQTPVHGVPGRDYEVEPIEYETE